MFETALAYGIEYVSAIGQATGLEYRWHGGLTVNVYSAGQAVESISMGGTDTPSADDFLSRVLSWEEYVTEGDSA